MFEILHDLKVLNYYLKSHHYCKTHLSDSKVVTGFLTYMHYLVTREQLKTNIYLKTMCDYKLASHNPTSLFLPKVTFLKLPKCSLFKKYLLVKPVIFK